MFPYLPGSTGPHARYDRRVLDPKVFKAYDVRGIYGDELDEEGAYAIRFGANCAA